MANGLAVASVSHVADVVSDAALVGAIGDGTNGCQFDSPTFARDIGSALRHARRCRKIRLRHLADSRLTVGTLKAAERGELELSRHLLTELASRYGIDLGALFPARQRVHIGEDSLAIGGCIEPCDVASLTSLLQAYLTLIDRVRSDANAKTRPLRRDDIRALSDQLDLPCTTVICRLADLLEARGAETRAMIDLYLTGASVVGLHEVSATEAASA